MKFNCPRCRRPLLAENINVQTDLAVCKECGEVSRVSALVDTSFDTDILRSPPAGAWYNELAGEHVVGATTRSAMAFFLVPFMCVWSGFSLYGIYGTQIRSGHFSPFISLFGIPFILGSLLFWAIALMACCGRLVVRVRNGAGTVFTGVGPIGWTRRFNLDEVDRIDEQQTFQRNTTSGSMAIVLSGRTVLRFGSNLSDQRRYFVMQVLKRLKSQRIGRR